MEVGGSEQRVHRPQPPVHGSPAVGRPERRRRGPRPGSCSKARSRSPANPPTGCVFHTRCHRAIAGVVRGDRAAAHRGRAGPPDGLPYPARGAADPLQRAPAGPRRVRATSRRARSPKQPRPPDSRWKKLAEAVQEAEAPAESGGSDRHGGDAARSPRSPTPTRADRGLCRHRGVIMESASAVRRALPADREVVAEIVTLSFANDPLRWSPRDGASRWPHRPSSRLLAAVCRRRLALSLGLDRRRWRGRLPIWIPPGGTELSDDQEARLEELVEEHLGPGAGELPRAPGQVRGGSPARRAALLPDPPRDPPGASWQGHRDAPARAPDPRAHRRRAHCPPISSCPTPRTTDATRVSALESVGSSRSRAAGQSSPPCGEPPAEPIAQSAIARRRASYIAAWMLPGSRRRRRSGTAGRCRRPHRPRPTRGWPAKIGFKIDLAAIR